MGNNSVAAHKPVERCCNPILTIHHPPSTIMPRALLSVSDKTGLVDFAQRLQKCGWEVLSTGGTEKTLKDAGIAVTPVEDVTEFPECFGGRVKTMHPKIMGGILMRRDNPEDIAEAKKQGIDPIDLVVVNLYPFEEAVLKGATEEEMIKQIDIGGPTMLRSAAKNYAHVTVVTDTADYERVIAAIEKGGVLVEMRKELAVKVFERTMAYDAAITKGLSDEQKGGILLTNRISLRYGENPHQRGAFYELYGRPKSWRVTQEEAGKPMSYLNLLDADGAWNL